MPDAGAALVAQILEAPEDDAARLVLADWLEEQGSPRADLIRLQCQRVPGTVTEELAARCASEVSALAEWVRPPMFERGLIRVLQVPTGTYATAATQKVLLAHLPRIGVELTTLRGQSKKLGTCASLAWTAHLHWWDCQLDDAAIARFGASPHLGRLSGLMFEKVKCTDAGLAALARSPTLPRLRRFGLPAPVNLGDFTTAGVRQLLESPHLSIEELRLGAATRVNLAELAPSATRLRSLEVWTTKLDDFARTEWPQLTTLVIHSYRAVADADVEPLIDNPGLARVQALTVRAGSDTELSPPVARRLRERFGMASVSGFG